jgi:hypothetical protein
MTAEEAKIEVFEIDQADHHKHMDYIQSVISRLANNSFVMKGWALTLSSTLLGFAASQSLTTLALAAVIPAVVFWLLDTYYLRQERAFREMFKDVAAKRVGNFEIKPTPYAKNQPWLNVGFSISLSVFYGAIIVVCLAVTLILALAPSSKTDQDSQDISGCSVIERSGNSFTISCDPE